MFAYQKEEKKREVHKEPCKPRKREKQRMRSGIENALTHSQTLDEIWEIEDHFFLRVPQP